MSAALSRRRALAGSALAALGLGAAAVPAVAAGEARAATSAEARALQDEAGRLSREYRVACREADETLLATPEVEPPETLYARPDDTARLWMRFPVPSYVPGRPWYGDHDLVDKMRLQEFRCLSGGRDEAAIARRDEIVSAWDRWHADMRAAEDASGHTAAQARFVTAYEAYSAFRLRLAELRTADPEVLTVKALVLRDLCPSAERFDWLLSSAIERDGAVYETALALSLARDFLALMGADLQEAAHG